MPSQEPAIPDCRHPDFAVFVDVHRLFDVELTDEQALAVEPDSLAINMRAECSVCGKRVRFEGPIGAAVGPGAPAMVSVDGLELRASGHLGENRSAGIRATLTFRREP